MVVRVVQRLRLHGVRAERRAEHRVRGGGRLLLVLEAGGQQAGRRAGGAGGRRSAGPAGAAAALDAADADAAAGGGAGRRGAAAVRGRLSGADAAALMVLTLGQQRVDAERDARRLPEGAAGGGAAGHHAALHHRTLPTRQGALSVERVGERDFWFCWCFRRHRCEQTNSEPRPGAPTGRRRRPRGRRRPSRAPPRSLTLRCVSAD